MTTEYLDEDIARDEGYAEEISEGRCIAYPDPCSPYAQALRMPAAKRPAGWQNFSPEPWTIGYGTTGPDVTRNTIWTQAQAYVRLTMKRAQAVKELDARLPWWRRMNDERQDVLANMAYNLGMPRLMGFRKALAAMQSEQWALAASEMLDSTWATQVGDRAIRLARQMHDGVRAPA